MANDALVTALFAAYATFTAFGAAIAGFVAAGGAVQALTSWWTQRGDDQADTKLGAFLRRLNFFRRSATWAINVITAIILLVILISGVGLVLCFVWLNAYSHGHPAGIRGTYDWILGLFWVEATLLTVATIVAVVAAALSAVTGAKSAFSSADLDTAVRDAAIGRMYPPR